MTSDKHSLGHEYSFHSMREPSYGTFTKPTSALPGLIEVLESSMSHVPERLESPVANPNSQFDYRTVQGKHRATWSAKQELMPSGTLGTPCDADSLLKLHFGGKVITKFITIVSYAVGTGDTVTITIVRRGASTVTVLTEGVDFDAVTSNSATAIDLATAIALIDKIASATPNAPSTGIITIVTDEDVDSLTIAISDAAFATTAGGKITYQHTTVQKERGSNTLVRKSATEMIAMIGAWCNEWTLTGKGGDAPTWTFSGGASSAVKTGTGVVSGAPPDSDTILADGPIVENNSVVAFRDPDSGDLRTNTNAGYLVSGVSGNNFNTTPAHGASDLEIIEPFVSTGTPTGSVLAGINGSFTKAGVSFNTQILEYEIKSNHGLTPFLDSALVAGADGFADGKVTLTGKMKIRMAAADTHHLIRHNLNSATTYSLVLTIGDTSGSMFEIDINAAQITEMPTEFKPGAVVTFDLSFRGLATARTANDGIQVLAK